jgi:hypothetical protein
MHYYYDRNNPGFAELNPRHPFGILTKQVQIPTLIIDINLLTTPRDLVEYIDSVVSNENCPDFDQIIFDATLDPMRFYQENSFFLNAWAKQYGIKCILAMSQFELQAHTDLIEINYPSWLFVFKNQNLPKLSLGKKGYNFSCLNRAPRTHRLMFYSLIKQRNLLDNFVYTFYDRDPYRGHLLDSNSIRDVRQLSRSSELADLCYQNLLDFPLTWPGDELGVTGTNDHSLNHPAYNNAYCNVVTETSPTVSFTSEKIWKPIAAGQIFYVVGAPGTVTWLKKLGYLTFDDGYDLQDRLEDRLVSIADRIEKQNTNMEQWYKDCQDQISHNYELFHSGAVEANILAPIIELLN